MNHRHFYPGAFREQAKFPGKRGRWVGVRPGKPALCVGKRFIARGWTAAIGRWRGHDRIEGHTGILDERGSRRWWREGSWEVKRSRRGRARLEGISGCAGWTLEMSQNPIHEPGVGDDRDDLHLGAARAQQRIHLENLP